MAGKLDQVPQPVREAISIALFIGAITSTAAVLLNQPMFLVGGVILFAVVYFLRIRPSIQAIYLEQANNEKHYAADDTYQPILARFEADSDDDALIDAYNTWKQGPYDNEVRLRFLQEAILRLINAGKIYRIEELFAEMEPLAQAEGLGERFIAFRATCDQKIAEIAQRRL